MHYDYLILGGGMAGDAAAAAIRKIDPHCSIGMISAESDPPYKRPPLTKGLWKGKPEDSVWLKSPQTGIDLHLNTTIVSLNPTAKILTDKDGTEYGYNKLLLATGGTPRNFDFTANGRVIYYRTFADYQKLRALAENGDRFLVIGGGFIGSEITAALAMNQKNVTMLFPEQAIGSNVYPTDISAFLNDYYREKGVNIIPGDTAASIETHNDKTVVRTAGDKEFIVDGVIAGLGITPNIDLARAAGLKVDSGIHVDDLLRTSDPNIFAAGDAAEFYNSLLSKHLRVEHEDNAVAMGAYAGTTMAGEPQPYHYLPYFYSDLFDIGYEAVGEVSSKNETFADWKEPFKEGVIYYLRNGRVRGVLLWNVWDKVPAARELIAQHGPCTPDDLIGRI